MTFSEMHWALEPLWPWSIPVIGPAAMAAAAVLLAALTLWTYLGIRKLSWSRLALLLVLRLLALVLAFLTMVRPHVGIAHFEGIETSKALVLFDNSESMNIADVPGRSTRWEQVNELWRLPSVQRRLDQLATEQKVEVVKYLAAEELRPDEAGVAASGKRTDMGAWLHEVWQKHGHEKRVRGIAVFSDGADNGTRFSALDKARAWRGTAAIHCFGVGDSDAAKQFKDLALTNLLTDTSVAVKSEMKLKAIAQAPGFKESDIEVSVWMEEVGSGKANEVARNPKIHVSREKNAEINLTCMTPDQPGEYKVTVKISPQPDETRKDNNEISTYVQVIKNTVQILWVDRSRFYEPTLAIRALKTEKRFNVFYVEPPLDGKEDPVKWYGLDRQHYDVIVIGDMSARQFSFGDVSVFAKLKELVEAKRCGLLMLGGTETYGNGGWDEHRSIMDLMPVAFVKKDFLTREVRVAPTKEGLQYPFLQINADPKEKEEPWKSHFDPLDGIAALGEPAAGSSVLMRGDKGELAMAATRRGDGGRVVVFAGDSTAKSWLRPDRQAVPGYLRFWKQLLFWLAQQQDTSNPLWVDLDKRRMSAGPRETLSFSFGLHGKNGLELANAKFDAKIVGPKQEHAITFVKQAQQQRGTFQGPKEPGEYKLIIRGNAQDVDGSPVRGEASARFLVEADDLEMAGPTADHELLRKLAAATDGRFTVASEATLVQYLDELAKQVTIEARVKTVHWPDWKRLPASDHVRDQFAGLWQSFTLATFLLFMILLVAEWLLRRLWGLV